MCLCCFHHLYSKFTIWLLDSGEVCVCVCKTTIVCPRLRERHQDVLRQKLFKLKQEQGVESEPLFPIIKEERKNKNE